MSDLNTELIQACQGSLEQFMTEYDQVAGTVLASQDGLLLAKAVRSRNIEADAIAAMSASMLALADAMAGQSGRALTDKLISEAESCTLVILHAGQSILTVIGRANVNIGLVLSAARTTAKRIASLEDDMGLARAGQLPDNREDLVEKVNNNMQRLRVVAGGE